MLRFCLRSNLSLFMASMLLGLAMTLYIIRTVHVISQDEPRSLVYNNRRLPRTEIIEDTLAIGGRREDNVTPCVCKGKDSSVEATQQPLDMNTDERLYQPSFNPTSNHTLPNESPTIFMITPTHKRLTQKVDLVRLCQTLMLVPNVMWIIVEDSHSYTKLVTNVLSNCQVKSVHLHVKTTTFVSRRKGGGGHRGVEQRNRGLKWVRENHGLSDTRNGVVYFGDDDNGYDVKLFEEMRYTKVISIWPVAFVGMLRYEGPNCKDGKVVGFHTSFRPDRTFPIDMGAFAVNLQVLLAKPDVYINHKSEAGMLETTFLTSLGLTPSQLEAKAKDCKEIYVWHVKTEKPKMPYERQNPGDKTIEV